MVEKARGSKLPILFTLALVAGCSGPPGRDSEPLVEANAAYQPRVSTTHAGASYSLDADGVIRDASGATLGTVSALEISSYWRVIRAVGPDTFWVADAEDLALVVDGAITPHFPSAGVPENELSVLGLDARSATDAWVTVDVLGVDDARLCHFDGEEWTCEALPETPSFTGWGVAFVGGELFVEDLQESIVYRRTGPEAYEPIGSGEHVGLSDLQPIGAGMAVVRGVDEGRSPEALYLLGADGTLTRIRSETESFSYSAIAGLDGGLWFVTQQQQLDEDCTLLGACSYTSNWRQYVVWRYVGGALEEVGHLDVETRLEGRGPSDAPVLVLDSEGALLFAEGAWRTP